MMNMITPVKIINPTNGNTSATSFRIDTGADQSAVCVLIADKIGAVPRAYTKILDADGDFTEAPVYRLILEIGECRVEVDAVGIDLSKVGYGGLLGNDVLDRGVLVRNGLTGQWYFSIGESDCGRGVAIERYLLSGGIGFGLGMITTSLLIRK